MTQESFLHIPVLQQEALHFLKDAPGPRIVDGTLGGGGDTEALLAQLPQAQVLGIDRDPAALKAATARLAPFTPRFHPWHGPFSQMEKAASQIGWSQVDAILLDIGVSSPQIDTPERGFSFRFDAPLDMRMDPSSGCPTAADLLNTLPQDKLAEIFWNYGEERFSRPIARAIVARRQERPWAGTKELARLLEKIAGGPGQHGLPAPTRVFQALRIAVNHELDELEKALQAAERLLSPGGRLVVISFHSLEDRMVKHFLQHAALRCLCPPALPVCACHKQVTFLPLTKKPCMASQEEQERNPRASCAKLRAAQRTDAPPEFPAP